MKHSFAVAGEQHVFDQVGFFRFLEFYFILFFCYFVFGMKKNEDTHTVIAFLRRMSAFKADFVLVVIVVVAGVQV